MRKRFGRFANFTLVTNETEQKGIAPLFVGNPNGHRKRNPRHRRPHQLSYKPADQRLCSRSTPLQQLHKTVTKSSGENQKADTGTFPLTSSPVSGIKNLR